MSMIELFKVISVASNSAQQVFPKITVIFWGVNPIVISYSACFKNRFAKGKLMPKQHFKLYQHRKMSGYGEWIELFICGIFTKFSKKS